MVVDPLLMFDLLELWDDVLDRDPHSVTMEGHCHRFGQVGVMFVDTRGSRSFYKDNDKRHSYISGAQWQAIQHNLGPQGMYHSIITSLLRTQ